MGLYIYAFIHSFIPDISIVPLPVHYYSEVLRTTASHSEALQATVSEGLAQGLYMAAGVGLKPATLWTQDTELTTEPPRLTINAQLHWLPLSACIWLKILVLVVKSKLGLAPKYLRDHIRPLYLQRRIDHSALSTGKFCLFRELRPLWPKLDPLTPLGPPCGMPSLPLFS